MDVYAFKSIGANRKECFTDDVYVRPFSISRKLLNLHVLQSGSNDEKGLDDIRRDICLDLMRLKSHELPGYERGLLEIDLYEKVFSCYCFSLLFSFSIALIEVSNQCVLQDDTMSKNLRRVIRDNLLGLLTPPHPTKKKKEWLRGMMKGPFLPLFLWIPLLERLDSSPD